MAHGHNNRDKKTHQSSTSSSNDDDEFHRDLGFSSPGGGGLACRVVLGGVKCALRNAAPLDVWKLYRERLAADSAVRLGSYPFATEAQPVYEEINAEYPGVRCLCHTPPARCRRSKETTRR